MTTPMRVVVADDHPIVRDGLRAVLTALPEFTLVAEAADGATAVALVTEHRPDVVVMDLEMGGLDGLEATRRISERCPGVGVLILSLHDDDATVLSAIRAGALGYQVKGSGQDGIVRALQAVGRGEAYFGAPISRYVTAGVASRTSAALPELSGREREILGFLAAGQTAESIARKVHLSPKTVRNHLSHIYAKLGVANQAQAVAAARDAGITGTG
jgi:DNA-binding NarL/FixJ family response regulator